MLGWSTGLFVLGLAASAFLVGTVFVRLPDDYFSEHRDDNSSSPSRQVLHPVSLLRNLVGGLLVIVGIILCFLPGQGLLTVLVGVLLCDFPGKRRLERKLIGYPGVLPAINALRRRFGRGPLVVASPR